MVTIGWIGSILFSLCVLPQSMQCYRQGHARGVNSLFLWLWFWGEIFTTIYVVNVIGPDGPLLFNYAANFLCLLVILKFKHWERIK